MQHTTVFKNVQPQEVAEDDIEVPPSLTMNVDDAQSMDPAPQARFASPLSASKARARRTNHDIVIEAMIISIVQH